MRAVVAGGGVGGLAAAAALGRAGWAVTVISHDVTHEVRPATDREGHVLGLWTPGLRCLETLGVSAASLAAHFVGKSGYMTVGGAELASPSYGLDQ